MQQGVEYKFWRQNFQHKPSKMRYGLVAYLVVFQIIFIATFYVFADYTNEGNGKHEGPYANVDKTPKYYASIHNYSDLKVKNKKYCCFQSVPRRAYNDVYWFWIFNDIFKEIWIQ